MRKSGMPTMKGLKVVSPFAKEKALKPFPKAKKFVPFAKGGKAECKGKK